MELNSAPIVVGPAFALNEPEKIAERRSTGKPSCGVMKRYETKRRVDMCKTETKIGTVDGTRCPGCKRFYDAGHDKWFSWPVKDLSGLNISHVHCTPCGEQLMATLPKSPEAG